MDKDIYIKFAVKNKLSQTPHKRNIYSMGPEEDVCGYWLIIRYLPSLPSQEVTSGYKSLLTSSLPCMAICCCSFMAL